MVSTKQNPNPQKTKPIPTTSKLTTNQQRANDEQIENQQPRSQPPKHKTNTPKPRSQTENHQPNYHPNRPTTTIETQIATHWPKSQPTSQNLNPLLPNHKTHYWSTAPPIHCQKIERERVQERIKKKEQCEKKVIDFLGYGLMMDVLGFNLNDGFNFEFVFLGLIF